MSTHPTSPSAPFLPLAMALALVACQGTIGAPGGGAVDEASTCTEPVPGAAPLRRLTPSQYRASVAAVATGVALPELPMVDSSLEGGFANDVRGQGVSALLVETLATNARSVAAAARTDTGWLPCTDDTAECVATVAAVVGSRAYRRPLTAEEESALVAFLETHRGTEGLVGASAMMLEALLQAPQFLYLPEIGAVADDAPPGTVALTGPELATRLSYFLWNEPPDATLQAAAEAGELADPGALEMHARRMLEDPRAEATLDRFFGQWLRLDRLEEADLDRDLYPELNNEARQDLHASALAFARHAVTQDDGLAALHTSRTGFVNDRIAPFFGVSPPGSEELVPVELPAEERSGILTQPGVLTSTSHGLTHSPILRGVLVLDSVLCVPPPPPPPEILAGIEEPPEGSEAVTTRQKIEETHGTTECAHCHDAIDGVGFSFETYDALGRYRTEEHGQPVDDRGQLYGEPVAGAVDLAGRIVDSADARECFVTQWLRFALARQEVGADACQIATLTERLSTSGGDLRELIIALATSPTFRFRPTE